MISKNNNLYKLSPSDFKYLWEQCKHCYYRKVVYGVPQPSIGIPSIFSKMNGQVQSSVIGKNLHDLCPDLPSGTFVLKEGFLKSKPIPPTNKCFVLGRFDLLTKFDDGTYGVIDLKITDPKDEDLYKFENQLHAYKFALENPLNDINTITKISKMGLLIISPESVDISGGGLHFLAKPVWVEFKENEQKFLDFIDEVVCFLKQPIPESSASCKWCQYKMS